MGTTDLDCGNGLNQATAIKNVREEWNVEERCVATCFDTTSSNTGKFAGACILLEALIEDTLCCGRHVVTVCSKSYWGMSSKQYLAPLAVLKSIFLTY